MNKISALIAILFLSACVDGRLVPHNGITVPKDASTPDDNTPVETAIVAPPPPVGARSAEEFDTTSAEDRAQAAIVPAAAREVSLGETIVSLGDPVDPGFWVRTSLVQTVGPGRVQAGNGKSAQVELRPAADAAGSEASLATLRLLEVPLTGLVPLEIFGER